MDSIFDWLGHATCSAATGIGWHSFYDQYCLSQMGRVAFPDYRSVGQVVFFGLAILILGGIFERSRPQNNGEEKKQ